MFSKNYQTSSIKLIGANEELWHFCSEVGSTENVYEFLKMALHVGFEFKSNSTIMGMTLLERYGF